MILEKDFKVDGRHFIANIYLSAMDPVTDMIRPDSHRDPRKLRIKPKVYRGVIEEAGDLCKEIKKGDEVLIERWDYIQINVDEQRILCHEKDVLVVSNKPLTGVAVLGLIEDQKPKSESLNLDPVEELDKEYYFGQVLVDTDRFKKSDYLWLAKLERDQFKMGENILIFREAEDCLMMKASPEENEKIKEKINV